MIPISLGRVLVEPFDWLSVSQGRPVYQSVCLSVSPSVSQSTDRGTDSRTDNPIKLSRLALLTIVTGYLPTYLPTKCLSLSLCLLACPPLCLSVSLSFCHSGICNNIAWALEPNCLRPADPFPFLSGWSSNQAHFCSFTFPFWQIHWPYIYAQYIWYLVSAVSVCVSPWQFEASVSLSPWVWTQHFEIISGA